MSRRTSHLDRIVQMDALSAKLRAAEMRIEELEAERKGKVLVTPEQLREVEFHPFNREYMQCPACRQIAAVNEPEHKPDCWLAAKIKEAEGE